MHAFIRNLSLRTSIVAVLGLFCLMLLAGAGMGLLPLNSLTQTLESHAQRTRVVTDALVPTEAAFRQLLAETEAVSTANAANAADAAAQAGLARVAADWLAQAPLLHGLAQQARTDAEAAARYLRWVVLGVLLGSLAAVLLTLLTYWYLKRQVLQPVRQAVGRIEASARGDLTPAVVAERSSNEIGQLHGALAQMQSGLTEIVRQVRAGVEAIHLGAGEIAQGNADLSRRTEQQASSLENTAASMRELSLQVESNAGNAGRATQLVARSMAAAQRGGVAMAGVVETMRHISASAQQIAEIVGVIDGIAFRTNILALNAAVEAARASEAGRGFAVVAGEVRSLAQRSAEAAREIRGLIAASVRSVEEGNGQVEQARVTMREIEVSVSEVTDMMQDIDAASQEQSRGIHQVNQALALLDENTEQNAALVEQAAAAAASLEEQAGRLARSVALFKLAGTA